MANIVMGEDTFAKVVDPDVQHLVSENSTTTQAKYIVLTHDPEPLDYMPTVTVDGVVVTLGAPGSSADYIINRISAQQTVIQKNTPGEATIQIGGLTYDTLGSDITGLPIGYAVIGDSFVIQ